jgi:phage-related protein
MLKLTWIGSSREDLRAMPEKVQKSIGYALRVVQSGDRPEGSKPLSGFGSAKVNEIKENDRSGTYRAVYTLEVEHEVFVLHVFHKKSTCGKETLRRDIEMIKKRLKDVRDYLKTKGKL